LFNFYAYWLNVHLNRSFFILDSISDIYYHFGLFSLAEKKANVQLGDIVSFQLVDCRDKSQKAFNLQVVQSSQPQDASSTAASLSQAATQQTAGKSRDAKKGKIESLKGHVRTKKAHCFPKKLPKTRN
jgi:hypothetical protein